MRRALNIAFLSIIFFADGAAAELQYWVSVGSYRDPAIADEMLAEAAAKMGESFSLVTATTDSGYFYRVATGPYLTRELAEDRVRSAQDAGYISAWLWAEESDFASTQVLDTAGPSDLSYDFDLPDYDADDDFNSRIGADDELSSRRVPVPELVDEAPAGYQLNRMRRDGS